MNRRKIVKSLGAGGLASGVAAASSFPKPALSQGRQQWRLVTAWPANFPGLGTGANLLAELIGKMSDGRLTVEVFSAGEIVPAFEAMDAVGSGTAEMGHGAPSYCQGQVHAIAYVFAITPGIAVSRYTDFIPGWQALDV